MRFIVLVGLLGACSDAPDERLFADDEPLSADWSLTHPPGPLPPPGGSVEVVNEAMVGADVRVRVQGIAANVDVLLLSSAAGVGVGPCHRSGVCVDLLSPQVSGRATSNAQGVATFALAPLVSGDVTYQAVVMDPAGTALSPTVADRIAEVRLQWDTDRVRIDIASGESGYDFGIAETFAGYLGWYGEDCAGGSGQYMVCHQVVDRLALESVHPTVGGPGISFVEESVATLFAELHDGYVTYYLAGHDSGECWAWGDDPSYYSWCTPLSL